MALYLGQHQGEPWHTPSMTGLKQCGVTRLLVWQKDKAQ
jgi:hypothetical protein